MEDWQLRVTEELTQLLDRIYSLEVFIEKNPTFKQLPVVECTRLKMQLYVMKLYAMVLEDRIVAFL